MEKKTGKDNHNINNDSLDNDSLDNDSFKATELKNKYWVSNYDFLTDISKQSYPYEEELPVPSLDKRFTFCLDTSLIAILQSYLKLYLKEASRIVDLNYHKFKIDNLEMTQEEWIYLMIQDCDTLLNWDFLNRYSKEYNALLKSLFNILQTIMPSLWW